VPFLRPAELATDLSPDIDWVTFTLEALAAGGRRYDCFSLLRPTSPFRGADTIRRGWDTLLAAGAVDSLRAVEPCRQHPGKMWILEGNRMRPLLTGEHGGTPWHSRPYQALPPVYVQNASLEIAWVRTAIESRTIAGKTIVPFFTTGYEGLDVNDLKDWWYAEHLVLTGEAALPPVTVSGWVDSPRGQRANG